MLKSSDAAQFSWVFGWSRRPARPRIEQWDVLDIPTHRRFR
jgi:hypothetical protein